MSDLIKDSIDQAQNIALAGMKGGYEIGKRESAAKLAEKDAAIGELCEALRDRHGHLLSETEINYWKEWLQDIDVLRLMALQFLRAQEVLAKHAPVLPNLHSHHDRADFHDDKADGRPDMHVSTGPDNLGFDGKPVIR